MKKTAARLLSAALICAALTSFVYAEGDDISGQWGEGVTAKLAATKESATLTITGAEGSESDIIVVIAAYSAENRMLAAKSEKGAAASLKTVVMSDIPQNAACIKAFILGDAGAENTAIPLISEVYFDLKDATDPNQGTWIP